MGMQLIETIELASAAASIEFTSIPQDGTDLLLVFSLRDSAASANLEVNSTDATAFRLLYGTGSGTGSVSGTAVNPYIVASTATANTFGSGQVYFANYTSSSAKSASIETVQENNATSSNQGLYAVTFGSSAITSVRFVSNGTGFVQYSTASLYKITAD